MATISMTDVEYGQLLREKNAAENQVAELRVELTKAKMATGGDPATLGALTNLVRDLLACTRFAVSQLPPEVHKGWPWRELLHAIELMPMLVDADAGDSELLLEFRAFARECERVEKYRTARDSVKSVSFDPLKTIR